MKLSLIDIFPPVQIETGSFFVDNEQINREFQNSLDSTTHVCLTVSIDSGDNAEIALVAFNCLHF